MSILSGRAFLESFRQSENSKIKGWRFWSWSEKVKGEMNANFFKNWLISNIILFLY